MFKSTLLAALLACMASLALAADYTAVPLQARTPPPAGAKAFSVQIGRAHV